MKEFHKVLAKAQGNKAQFVQLLRDAHYEMNFEKRGFLDSVITLNRYYNAELTYVELRNLGKFIKSGKYNKQLEMYV